MLENKGSHRPMRPVQACETQMDQPRLKQTTNEMMVPLINGPPLPLKKALQGQHAKPSGTKCVTENKEQSHSLLHYSWSEIL
jgi:hypothetical protein